MRRVSTWMHSHCTLERSMPPTSDSAQAAPSPVTFLFGITRCKPTVCFFMHRCTRDSRFTALCTIDLRLFFVSFPRVYHSESRYERG